MRESQLHCLCPVPKERKAKISYKKMPFFSQKGDRDGIHHSTSPHWTQRTFYQPTDDTECSYFPSLSPFQTVLCHLRSKCELFFQDTQVSNFHPWNYMLLATVIADRFWFLLSRSWNTSPNQLVKMADEKRWRERGDGKTNTFLLAIFFCAHVQM